MPKARTAINTSPSPGSGVGISLIANCSGPPYAARTIASIGLLLHCECSVLFAMWTCSTAREMTAVLPAPAIRQVRQPDSEALPIQCRLGEDRQHRLHVAQQRRLVGIDPLIHGQTLHRDREILRGFL